MNLTAISPFDLWMKRLLTATLLVLVAALITLGVLLYGPGARAQGYGPQDRPLAAEGVIR
jgi:hypothetical protein